MRRYEYNNNIILSIENLVFLSNVTISFYTTLKRSLNSILENKVNLVIKATKLASESISKIISKTINIAEVEIISYYRLIRDKENKLFSLII